ncbi:MAG: nuclear transport factor 2 family protein [Bryobacteraceae bacterium]
MNDDQAADTLEINNLLCRFMQSFDDKDWRAMRECLVGDLFCDYSNFRGTPAGRVAADDYVAARKEGLAELAMQHNFFNLRVTMLDHEAASARCNFVIHRFLSISPDSVNAYFHSYGHYRFTFTRTRGIWKISGIVQVLLKNAGNPEIHGAIRSSGAV